MNNKKLKYDDLFGSLVNGSVKKSKEIYANKYKLQNLVLKSFKLIYANNAIKNNNNIKLLFRMFLDIITLHYFASIKSMVVTVIAFSYLTFPFDFIWDFIPGIGMIDDYIVLIYTVKVLATELSNYKMKLDTDSNFANNGFLKKISDKEYLERADIEEYIEEINIDTQDITDQEIFEEFINVKDCEEFDVNNFITDIVNISDKKKIDEKTQLQKETVKFLTLTEDNIMQIIILIIARNDFNETTITKDAILKYITKKGIEISDLKLIDKCLNNLELTYFDQYSHYYQGIELTSIHQKTKLGNDKYIINTNGIPVMDFIEKTIVNSTIKEVIYGEQKALYYNYELTTNTLDYTLFLNINYIVQNNSHLNEINNFSVYNFKITDQNSQTFIIRIDLLKNQFYVYALAVDKYYFTQEISKILNQMIFEQNNNLFRKVKINLKKITR